MSKANPAHEPSMEEILASIRRIIESGEERPAASDSGPRPKFAGPAASEQMDGRGVVRNDMASKAIARLVAETEAASTRTEPDPALFDDEADAVIERDLAANLDIFGAYSGGRRPEAGEESDEPTAADAAASYAELTQQLEAELSSAERDGWKARLALADDPAALGGGGREDEGKRAGGDAVSFDDAFGLSKDPPANHNSAARPEAGSEAEDARDPLETGRRDETDIAIHAIGEAVSPGGVPSPAEPADDGPAAPSAAANAGDLNRPAMKDASMSETTRENGRERQSPLMSPQAGEMISASFDELSRAIREGEMKSMEDMAQDMLRPMLQEWLDDNLPKLVERLVREEIERVARGSSRR